MRDNEFKHRQHNTHKDISNEYVELIKHLQSKGVSKKVIRQLTGVGYTQQNNIKKS